MTGSAGLQSFLVGLAAGVIVAGILGIGYLLGS